MLIMNTTSLIARGTRSARRAADAVGGSRTARLLARAGLGARAGFYLLLAGLLVDVVVNGSSDGEQTNAHGALSTIASYPLGLAAVAAVALGFFVLGAVRVAGAIRDREAEARSRLTTGAQGVFYAALTWVPLSFAFGQRSTGSEQAQRSETATVLGWPGGQVLVALAGVAVVVVCGYQVWTAVQGDFTSGLDLRKLRGRRRRVVEVVGAVGIAARALVFLPIGGFLIAAAVQTDPDHAKGLDAELAIVARQAWWGPALLLVVAAGLVVFAAYSLVEARYRRVDRST